MNERDGLQVFILQQPTTNDREAWQTYWKEQGQPWRRKPEIDPERQKYLAQCRLIPPDSKQGVYPFKGIKLNRADIEWLLATHENGYGPAKRSGETQRGCEGVDLRGADLRGEDLSSLPLAKIKSGFTWNKLVFDYTQLTYNEQREAAAIHLEGANLGGADLSGAILDGADLGRANLMGANLMGANLRETNLRKADLTRALLGEANLMGANLMGATLGFANLKEAVLREANLRKADLKNADLGRANLMGADLQGAETAEEQLAGAKSLEGATMPDGSKRP